MPLRSCRATITDMRGIRHSADVAAESVFEAAGLAIAIFEKEPWCDPIGPATRLEIEVREPATTHAVTMLQLQRWLDSAGTPNDLVKKNRLRGLLVLRSAVSSNR